MDYREMKVAELKSLCAERGITFPSGAKKAQLVEWLEAADLAEPIEVEAVTVEEEIIPSNALSVDPEAMKSAAIELTAAMDDASTALGEFDVDDDVLAAMDVSEVKVCENGIAAAINDVDARRKELTRLLTEPKKAIDAEVKKLTVPLQELAQRYADRRQEVYMEGYEAQYQECCIANGLERMIDAVPFDRFMASHKQWTSRTANPVKTQEKIAAEVERIARDWRRLQGLRGSMAFYDEAEGAFFDSLSIDAAISANEAAKARQERVEMMRRQQEENEAWKRAQQPVQTPVFTEVEPEPAPIAEPPAADEYAREAAHMRELAAEHVANGHPGRKRYHFEAWLDDAELASFREWKNACGIGEGWTFREIKGVA